ncbi:MAG: hypothetical protein J6J15_06870 [Oscillospiraceae bacterium]|nr:hypothetical protein [Oscillospiraceae bacterium]
MEFLIGLLPAFFWGFTPVVVNKLGGKPINQQLGTSFGCGILALGIFIFAKPEFTTQVIIGCIISGLAWSVGQLCQYTSYVILGTSKAFALSISIEMVLNAIVGVLIFHEWSTMSQIVLGLSAIACVILGGNLTSFTSEKSTANKEQFKKGFITLFIGACGFCVWNYALRVAGADGIGALCPQAIGMIIGSLTLSCFVGKDAKRFDVTTFKQIIPGLIYAAANATLVLSNMVNGVAVGYTMAQLCLVIETLLGFAILKEHKHKTPAELKHSIAGAIFITAGCIMVGLVGYV